MKMAQFVPYKHKKTTKPAQIVPDVQIRIRISGEIYEKIALSGNVSGYINWALLQHFALYDDIYCIRESLSEIGEYMMKNQKTTKPAQNVPVLLDTDEGELICRLRADKSMKTLYAYVKEKHPNIMLTPKEHLEIEKYYIKLINIIENE
jgi:hypothetical protein